MSENPVRSASEEAAKEVSKSFAELCDKETREKVYADIIESHLAPVVAAAEEAMKEKCQEVARRYFGGKGEFRESVQCVDVEMAAIPTGTAKEIAPCR